MEQKRLNTYQGLKKQKMLNSSIKNFDDFNRMYFSSEKNTKAFWDWCIITINKDTKNYYFLDTLQAFYTKYVCGDSDLPWAKSTTYCGGSGNSNTGGNTTAKPSAQGWDSCVDGVVPPGRIIDDNTITYISANVKGKVTLKKDHTFTSEVSDYSTGKWSCTASGKIFLDSRNSSSSTTDGSGSSTNPAVSWTDTNATEQDVANGTLIKKLMKGDIVTKIQNHLIKHGFNNISFSKKADGKFGSRTKKAVIDFQRSKGLKDDGVVGPKTWTELIKDKSSVATTTTSGGSTTTTTPTQTGSTIPAPDNKSDTSPIVVNTDTGI